MTACVDSETGIDPFQNEFRPIHPVMRVFRAVLACIKFPLFLILLSLSFFYYCLAFAVPIASLKKWIARVVFRILLLLCGVSHVTVEVPPLEQTVLGAGDPAPIRGGDLIVANFGSYLDLFWLQSTYCPIFIILAGSGHFCIHSIYSLFAAILTGSAIDAGKRSPIARAIQLAKARDVPVVVFPEGRPTNGRGLVRFAEFDASDADMHVMGFSHRFDGASPNFVAGNGFAHLFQMLGRTIAGMKVRIATPKYVKAIGEKSMEGVRVLLSRMLRVPLLDVGSGALGADLSLSGKTHLDERMIPFR
jgi:hypothetical protein